MFVCEIFADFLDTLGYVPSVAGQVSSLVTLLACLDESRRRCIWILHLDFSKTFPFCGTCTKIHTHFAPLSRSHFDRATLNRLSLSGTFLSPPIFPVMRGCMPFLPHVYPYVSPVVPLPRYVENSASRRRFLPLRSMATDNRMLKYIHALLIKI